MFSPPTNVLLPQPSPGGLSHGLNNPKEEALATEGEYARFYDTLGPIGRGAFGFVKMARHREEKELLVSHDTPGSLSELAMQTSSMRWEGSWGLIKTLLKCFLGCSGHEWNSFGIARCSAVVGRDATTHRRMALLAYHLVTIPTCGNNRGVFFSVYVHVCSSRSLLNWLTLGLFHPGNTTRDSWKGIIVRENAPFVFWLCWVCSYIVRRRTTVRGHFVTPCWQKLSGRPLTKAYFPPVLSTWRIGYDRCPTVA